MIKDVDFSEIKQKILAAIIQDEQGTIYGFAETIKENCSISFISKLIYFLINNNKDLSDELLNKWNLEKIIKG